MGFRPANRLRLGVNIDHVATIRNARGGVHPAPLRAARLAAEAGADGITIHLREDRRHISDQDVRELVDEIRLPINLEMAATPEMLNIALRHKPHAACIVPENRQEVTTEGGLDVLANQEYLAACVATLREAGIRVSLFIDPVAEQLQAAKDVGAPVVELHTGQYCEAALALTDTGLGHPLVELELERLRRAAAVAASLGLECHAGHGLTFDSVTDVAAIPEIIELNIGHFLIGEAIFTGLDSAIRRMRTLMDSARGEAG